ncbi:uncharacterized protein [Typha latifolia]|uniref:uncharacterized protein isoform X2 n=1 Tax=Typha latifolia TaxID=4733 RepID=UPI003C2B1009
MYHCVPNFEVHSAARELKVDDDDDEDVLMPTSLGNFASETELMELVWRKGPVLNPVSGGARIRVPDPGTPHATLPIRADVSVAEVATRLFAEEDEMTSWLSYQMGERENGSGGDLYSGTPVPPPPDANRSRASGESTVVGPNTQFTRDSASNWDRTSSLRKRKASLGDDSEYHSGEDDELEFEDEKKDRRRSVAPRRSRAAEVHNLSERKRRDRINEKMKALQELIPRCNKSDKASMLDEAIEYLKSLQLQVQDLFWRFICVSTRGALFGITTIRLCLWGAA